MVITDLVTMLTDYAIAVETTFFAVLLLRGHRIEKLWAIAFGSVSVASFLGGTYHGFEPYFEIAMQLRLWRILLGAVGSASFFMLIATSLDTVSHRLQPWFIGIAVLKLLVYLYCISNSYSFTYAIVDYFLALIAVGLLYTRSLRRHKDPGAAWMIAGVLISGIAAGLLPGNWTLLFILHPVDVYHLVQMIGLYCFYRGVRQLT